VNAGAADMGCLFERSFGGVAPGVVWAAQEAGGFACFLHEFYTAVTASIMKDAHFAIAPMGNDERVAKKLYGLDVTGFWYVFAKPDANPIGRKNLALFFCNCIWRRIKPV